MDYGIFNVRTDVNACDFEWVCTETIRQPALKVESGKKKKKKPCRTGESNLRRRRAGPMFYQLSYIPTPRHEGTFLKHVKAPLSLSILCPFVLFPTFLPLSFPATTRLPSTPKWDTADVEINVPHARNPEGENALTSVKL